ncbi:MAG: DUF523 domain-containing protein [Epsilonproteobacteria bacterium]|nr:DUF523 domain-containing protein [Campylobacterota bacterium]OIO14726.1 MAG: hypothetical protein AUJ81_08890 [Helicobacteraceae bacterium CG1_02_36_14]PIP09456.1 MAG: hypothetical protein COX50_10755 [Sulfurimonas sp. CG23_combo_of_CG06-09_8_20_14_all_36_33]PIS26843.1 MAG: hypothetical protein COT46_01195 [Sulfurimonas sp. CG08_land_8_20_14_0_20_36_33]PIU34189.1 MAG: hypothetical protein COT05_08850 [Sulfurimonas sp. CG07_land_8_20_14_0_80_36_56]PIV05272.1 MAG: hypothetical protein COS56_0
MRPKAIISACLLGEMCRYDGETKEDSAVLEAFKEYEIIPFCPEAPLFGTPRERINVVRIQGKNRIITEESCRDVTQLLKEEINSFIKKFPHANAIVLKSKSPSCGLGTTPVYDENKKVVACGNGIAAEIFLNYFGENIIKSEI